MDIIEAANVKKATVDIEIPVYMNEEKTIMMDLVQVHDEREMKSEREYVFEWLTSGPESAVY